jgi:hypothetical protein
MNEATFKIASKIQCGWASVLILLSSTWQRENQTKQRQGLLPAYLCLPVLVSTLSCVGTSQDC